MKIKQVLNLILYVGMAIVMAYILVDRHAPTLAVGDKAPIDEKISLLSGGNVSLRRYLRKPLVLNVWASFCQACMQELPALATIAKKYSKQVTLIGAAFSTPIDDIVAIKKKYALPYELVIVNDNFVDAWHARVLPTTYVIDQQGVILFAKTGIIKEEELESVLSGLLDK